MFSVLALPLFQSQMVCKYQNLHFSVVALPEILTGDANLSHMEKTQMKSRYFHFNNERANLIRDLPPRGADSLESVKNSSPN